MASVSFRPFVEEDLPQMFGWLRRPHVKKWYGSEPRSYLEVVAKYGGRAQPGGPVTACVILVDGADAGYVQRYRLEDFPEYRAALGLEAEGGVVGMDLFIGDEWRTNRGLGSLAIRRFFLEQVLADPLVNACVAGPHEGNAGSIRAFEKAGFTRWKVVPNERGERECVMRRERDTGTYRIAPIDLRHAATCARMHREMYLASFGDDIGLEEEMGEGDAVYLEQLRAKVASVPEGNAHLWRDGEIVGQLETRLLDDDDVLYLSLIHITEKYRGHGLGRQLHAHAMAVAKNRGKRLMRLSVARSNTRALLFYRRLGWVVVGARPNRVPMAVMEIPVR